MAVTITKKFWNSTEYKSIAKIVFTSPNFTSPAVAGTRSHMPPGGIYMGTWFEAVDWMYRQKANQDYVNLPTEMEGFFGKLTLSGTFDLDNDTTALFTHEYGIDYDVVGQGSYPNIVYLDKDNYGVIASCTSGTLGDLYTANITFSSVIGTGVVNDWLNRTTSGDVSTSITGIASPVGDTTTVAVSESVSATVDDSGSTSVTGTLTGNINGTLSSIAEETVSGTLSGDISGTLTAPKNIGLGTIISSSVTDNVTVVMTGHDYGTVTGTLNTSFSGTVGEAGDTVNATVSGMVSAQTSDSKGITLSGMVSGDVSAVLASAGSNFVDCTLTGPVSGRLIGDDAGDEVRADVSGNISIYVFGAKNGAAAGTGNCSVSSSACGVITGTLDSEYGGSVVAPSEIMFHQYSGVSIDNDTTLPRTRRHNGSNSVIFAVTFGEAYDCRLTAWDDDTHSTTTNKVINEEHYRVDAVAYRSNLVDTAHSPMFRTASNLVYPAVYDAVLKGNERYYGDFDLVFAIEANNYGEYLAFIPRLVNMDDSFIAGSYDFVTTLHYQYT